MTIKSINDCYYTLNQFEIKSLNKFFLIKKNYNKISTLKLTIKKP